MGLQLNPGGRLPVNVVVLGICQLDSILIHANRPVGVRVASEITSCRMHSAGLILLMGDISINCLSSIWRWVRIQGCIRNLPQDRSGRARCPRFSARRIRHAAVSGLLAILTGEPGGTAESPSLGADGSVNGDDDLGRSWDRACL
jgi:hypothetical protein